jgi:Spy/CpxP family protein refolding chaperone
MMNRRSGHRRFLFFLLSFLVCVPTLAAGEPGDGRRGRDGGRGPDPDNFIAKHADELGIDTETREAIQAVSDAARERAVELKLTVRDEQRVLRQLLSEPSPDEAAVMAQSDRVEAGRAAERRNRLAAMLEIRRMLTPEQRASLVALRGKGNRGREGRRGRNGLRAMCRDDVATLCSEAVTGRERLQCLDSNWDQVSAPCRQAFERSERGRRRRDAGSAPLGD